MSANCDALAAEDFVLAHISMDNVRDMYNQLSFRDFVRSHPQLRFCPGNNCKLIIKAVVRVAKSLARSRRVRFYPPTLKSGVRGVPSPGQRPQTNYLDL